MNKHTFLANLLLIFSAFTSWIPPCFKYLILWNIYPSSDGCAQTAGIKIQLEYDLHSGQFLNFQVGPGKNNDITSGTECINTLRPRDLCIHDLGCFSLEDLNQMD